MQATLHVVLWVVPVFYPEQASNMSKEQELDQEVCRAESVSLSHHPGNRKEGKS